MEYIISLKVDCDKVKINTVDTKITIKITQWRVIANKRASKINGIITLNPKESL